MKKTLLAAAVLAAASFGASAAENTAPTNLISYTYVEGDYVARTMDVDMNNDVDFNGYGVKGSYEIGDQFHVFGAYSKVNNDDVFDIDLDETQLGFGWHKSVADNADAIVELSWLRQGVDVSLLGVSADDHADGYRASAGFRGAFSDHVLGNFKVNYTDGSDFKSEFTPSFGVEVKFNEMFSAVADAEVGNGNKMYSIGLRANF
jgi:opacity protein-like surface antigen